MRDPRAGRCGLSDHIRIALVDDQELFRAGVAVIIDAQPDMEVVASVGSGAEAIVVADDLAPDIVLMDIRMPGIDGVDATRQIYSQDRVAQRTTDVRVIVLTTFNLDDRAAEAIRLGASGFLLKDVTPKLLLESIRTVYRGSAILAPQEIGTLFARTPGGRRAKLPPAYNELTAQQFEVLRAVARGRSNAEIAAELFLGVSTVKTHVGAVLRKLGLRDRVQIVVFAYEHGLVDVDDTAGAGTVPGS